MRVQITHETYEDKRKTLSGSTAPHLTNMRCPPLIGPARFLFDRSTSSTYELLRHMDTCAALYGISGARFADLFIYFM